MSDTAAQMMKARQSLEFARYTLAGEYAEEAGRSAYMAAFHAALALLLHVPGNIPRLTVLRAASSRVSHVKNPGSVEIRCHCSGGAMN